MFADNSWISKYTEELPAAEAHCLHYLLRTYSAGDLGTGLMQAIREVDKLGTAIKDGYDPLTDDDRVTLRYKGWYRSLQVYIESLAHPSVGRDRLAIALGCFRDFVVHRDPQVRWENLEECRRQLLDLYNVTAPLPFTI